MQPLPTPPWVSPVSPDAIARFELDLTAWLEGDVIANIPIATVSNVTEVSNPGVSNTTVTGNIVSVWLSAPGWIADTQYTLTITVDTNDGRQESFSMRMWCGQR